MERLLQYLDDLDDLAGVVGLTYERSRRLLLNLIRITVGLLLLAALTWLALSHPVIAVIAGLLLVVVVLYRMVGPRHGGTPKSV